MKIKHILFFIWLSAFTFVFAQVPIRVTSWNLCNFGKSKSDSEIVFIANTIKNTDILAIQEVSDNYYGAQAVAKLADELNRTGSKWAYILSNPTHGKGSERYAYLWKPSIVKLKGKAWLEKSLDNQIDREPFMARFELKSGKTVLLSTIHAVPKAKEPWKECKYLYKLNDCYKVDNLLIMGDFNLSERNDAFYKLKQSNIWPALINFKTSIKMEMREGEKFANEYDNIFIDRTEIKLLNAGRIDFTLPFISLKEARKISDHVPVYAEIRL